MNSYLARQPVLNRNKETIGYELLFRDGPQNCFPDVGDEQATHRLLTDNFLSAGTSEVTAGKIAFINFPQSSLIKRTPLIFPKRSFIIEVLESCEPNDDLLLAIQELHQKGYTLALDDFIPTAEWNRFLPFVHIIKFDIRATPIAKAGFFIRRHREQGSKLLFLAEKVETYDEYQAAKQAGFDLFQGFFFSRPEMVQRKTLNPYALTTLRLFSEISQPVVDFDKVERIIASDVSLSYKLLHHVNCMTYTRAKPISSFKQALVYLGEEKLRHFITFVATAHVMEDKPMSLYHLSLQRAWFCERLSMNFPGQIDKNQAFLTGLFSLLDSILDQPIEVLVEQLPLPAQVHQALIKQQGHLGGVLRLVKAYDEANWPQVQRLCQLLGLDESIVAERYMESLKWSADFEQNMPKN
ncbi:MULTISPECIES: EAL and HDOD domain-containing protein [Photobacterium]|uniref:Histidine kinase n=1 Tax=Photobacterium ganghwense TaxID=320778 RepID=A0A0J1HI80_9GAMM|nr:MULTISPECIES: HDOD domain-containing protein [Photobacterium]KLV11300.1 histidine kinase [Photobacterium ganghwense]MBV1842473.1 HDOD domain-containing protein [Photobacterium ganghwense]PSU08143.1 HDOD domain-containing protein [Photobacterium ganghwense]QSV14953.1 HDOD domain-containing protein [Photobacterium ganghwense]